MAGQIRLTPDQMRQRSGEVRTQGETFGGVIDRMQSIINELRTEWEGQASSAINRQEQNMGSTSQQYNGQIPPLQMQERLERANARKEEMEAMQFSSGSTFSMDTFTWN